MAEGGALELDGEKSSRRKKKRELYGCSGSGGRKVPFSFDEIHKILTFRIHHSQKAGVGAHRTGREFKSEEGTRSIEAGREKNISSRRRNDDKRKTRAVAAQRQQTFAFASHCSIPGTAVARSSNAVCFSTEIFTLVYLFLFRTVFSYFFLFFHSSQKPFIYLSRIESPISVGYKRKSHLISARLRLGVEFPYIGQTLFFWCLRRVCFYIAT